MFKVAGIKAKALSKYLIFTTKGFNIQNLKMSQFLELLSTY